MTGAGDTRFLNTTCVSECNCNSTIFEPVCGADDITYFSPCRASCQKTLVTNNGVGFSLISPQTFLLYHM